MNNNPFKPDQPNIPGVLPRDEATKAAEETTAEATPAPSKFSAPQMPPLWVILSATSVVAVCLLAVWWMRGTSAKEPSAAGGVLPLGFTPARDQSRPLQNFEVLGDGGHAHLKRFGQFRNRNLARRQACQDGAPRGIGQGRERRAEWIGWGCL